MRIALATLNGTTITSHFGRTKVFVVVDVDDGVEKGRESRPVVSSPGVGELDPKSKCRPDDIVATIQDCDVVIAGGMGHPIQERLQQADLEVVLTSVRPIDEVVALYAAGTLTHEPDRVHTHGGNHRH